MARKRLRVLFLHWFPLEKFPPAQNLLACFSEQEFLEIEAVSTAEAAATRGRFATARVFRTSFPAVGQFAAFRLLRFLAFPVLCLLRVLLRRPDVIIYCEPHSAPAAFLALLFRPRMRLFIHYHEYRELSHYRDRGNAIAQLGHWLESRWLYHRCEWISHTNMDRVRMFLEDHPGVPQRLLHAIPNYPPPAWLSPAQKQPHAPSTVLRLVYVGAVSLNDTFIRELVDWVVKHGDERVQLDIYAGNTAVSARDYLLNLQSPAVKFFPTGVPYEQLPEILVNYDVGLVLYRGTTRNYIYNAPNKLFEYLICGLDVWYPRQMLGVSPVAAELHIQQVLELDFEQPQMLDALLELPRRDSSREWQQTCRDALQPLLQGLLNAAPCS
jgi:hypothetical protein